MGGPGLTEEAKTLWLSYRIALRDNLTSAARDALSVRLGLSPSMVDQVRTSAVEALSILEAYRFISTDDVEKLERASQKNWVLSAIHTITRKYEAEYAALHHLTVRHRDGSVNEAAPVARPTHQLPPCKCCRMTQATYVLIPCGHLYCCDLCMVAGADISCRVKGCSAAVERVQKLDLSPQ